MLDLIDFEIDGLRIRFSAIICALSLWISRPLVLCGTELFKCFPTGELCIFAMPSSVAVSFTVVSLELERLCISCALLYGNRSETGFC